MNKAELIKAIKDYFTKLVERVAGKGGALTVVDVNSDIQKIIERVEQKSWKTLPEFPKENGFYYVTLEMPSGKRETEYCFYEKQEEKFYFIAEGTLEENQTWKEEADNVIAWQEELKPYMGDMKPLANKYPEIMRHFTRVE